MNALNTLRWWALLAALLLVAAACGGDGGPAGEQASTKAPVQDGAGGEAADLGFTLSSFARGGGGTQALAGGATAGQVELSGQLLVVNTGEQTEKTYDWALTVDSAAFRIDTEVKLKLDGGTYAFYFLLAGGGNSYGGMLPDRLIVGGSNKLQFVLHPIVAAGTVTVQTLRTLAPFSFQYDPAAVGEFTDPAFSVSVDGAGESAYSINVRPDEPAVTLWMAPGQHELAVRFYDGANLKLVGGETVDVPPPPPTGSPPPAPEPTPIEVVPVQTAVTYTYTPTGSPTTDQADVTFVVPPVIVDEAGGLGTLLTTVAVVGPLTPLFEATLTLALSDGSYEGSLRVPGFTSGPLTWSLQFRDTRDGQLFAYCAQSVTIPQTDTQISETFICEPSVLTRAVPPPEPPAGVVVSVTDPDAVPGAVVQANDETLGITGNGAGGEPPGGLASFLPGGTYEFNVVHKALDPFGSGEVITRTGRQYVGLEAGKERAVSIVLPSLSQPIVPCADGGQVEASKAYSPSQWRNGQCSVPSPLLVTIGDAFTVKTGGVGNQWATLIFENKDGSRVVCMFQGTGTAYGFHHCYNAEPSQTPPELTPNQVQLGDAIVVDGSIALKINGEPKAGVTRVAWTIEAAPALDQEVIEEEPEVGEPPAQDGGDDDLAPLEYVRVTASRTSRPRRYYDGHTRLDGWAKIRIPGHDQLVVAPGDPNRFLTIVYFGRGVKCWYIGGRWDSTMGGLLERFFKRTFSSPACTKGMREGSTMWVRGTLKARVIAGSPRLDTTQVVVDVPVVRWWNRDEDHKRDQGKDNDKKDNDKKDNDKKEKRDQ